MLARATQGRHKQLPLQPEGILGNVVLLVISTFRTLLHRERSVFIIIVIICVVHIQVYIFKITTNLM